MLFYILEMLKNEYFILSRNWVLNCNSFSFIRVITQVFISGIEGELFSPFRLLPSAIQFMHKQIHHQNNPTKVCIYSGTRGNTGLDTSNAYGG